MGNPGGKLIMMWQTALLLNKQKSLKTKSLDQGFITLEIIISMLVGFFFIILALQTVVSGLAFKVLAQKEFGGDRLIQEEIERLNDLASENRLSLVDPGLDPVDEEDDDDTDKISACNGIWDSGDGSGDDGHGQALWNLRLTGNTLAATSPADTFVVNPNVANNTNVVGRVLTLTATRNTTDPGGATTAKPFKVLGVNYVVTAPDENGDGIIEEIARRYVEVIPDEALECS